MLLMLSIGSITAAGADVTATDDAGSGDFAEVDAAGSSARVMGNGKSFDAPAPPRRLDINACSRSNASSSSSSSLIVAPPTVLQIHKHL